MISCSRRCGKRKGGRSYGRQYMEVVFPANGAQAQLAEARGISSLIEGARFHVAEAYHQKYYLQHDSTLMRELADYSPAELRESTLAARLNGYVAGKGSRDRLDHEIGSFGLSADATLHLERVVSRR